MLVFNCLSVAASKRPRAQMFAEELVRDLVDLPQIGRKTVRRDWIWLSLEFVFQFLVVSAKKKQNDKAKLSAVK